MTNNIYVCIYIYDCSRILIMLGKRCARESLWRNLCEFPGISFKKKKEKKKEGDRERKMFNE